MLWICIAIMALAAICVVFYLIEKIKAYSVKELLIKAFISLLFLVLAIYCSYVKHRHVLNLFIIIGLVFGFTGDIWLDLKYIYPKDDKVYTYAGFIVFGIGHIFFITGMYLEFFNNAHFLYILIPILIALVAAIGNQFLAKPLKLDFKDKKWIAFSYSIFLFSLPLCTASLLMINGWQNTTLLLLFIGGVLFVLSDLVLSGTYFGEGHEKPIDFFFNYLFYYSAQFIIAFSIFFL